MLLVLRSPSNASFNYFLELSIDFTYRAEGVTLDFSRSKTISYHFKRRASFLCFAGMLIIDDLTIHNLYDNNS
jgi:hypothetical protein